MASEAAAELADTGSEEEEELEQLDFGDSDDWGGEVSQNEEDQQQEEEEEEETDPARLLQRQKQVDYGKNTIGYERYIVAVPKNLRKKKGKDMDPPTPDIKKKMTKRTWDGIVKVWRRHLHKFEDMDVPTAEAKAAELKARLLEARRARAEELGLPVKKPKATPTDQVRAGKREQQRRKRLATIARQQRQQQQQQRHDKDPTASAAPQQQAQQVAPAEEPQKQQLPKPAPKPATDPQQQQHQQKQEEGSSRKEVSTKEWGSADKREHSSRSKPYASDSRQGHSSEDRERDRDRQGRYGSSSGAGDREGRYGSSSKAGDRDKRNDRGSGRDREWQQERERERDSCSSRDRGYDDRDSDRGRGYGRSERERERDYGSKQLYSRRSSDDRRQEDHYDSRRDSNAERSSGPQAKWQVVGDRRPTRSSGDKENSQGSKGAGKGQDDDTDFYDRSFGGSRSSRYNRADAASAAAAVAAAVKGLDCGSKGGSGNNREGPSGYKLDHPSSSGRRYSSLRQQLGSSRAGCRDGSHSEDGSDKDAPSPMRRQPVSLLSEDLMDWCDGTPSCPQRQRRHHTSWADDVEAAEALCNVCEVMMVASQEEEMEEGELPGGESPAGRAGTRPKSASMTPAKRTAACLV